MENDKQPKSIFSKKITENKKIQITTDSKQTYSIDDRILLDISPQQNPSVQQSNIYTEVDLEQICSIDDAILHIKTKPWQREIVYNSILKNKIYPNVDDFLELISLYMESCDYKKAYNLCELAIERFATSLDLYLSIIEISLHLDNPVMYAGYYLDNILCSDMKHWKKKDFKVIYNFFFKIINDNRLVTDEKIREILQNFFLKSQKVFRKMQKLFYGDEDGYYYEAKLLIAIGKGKEARHLLEEVIFYPLNAEIDSLRILQCPKCCRLWIENFRHVSGSINELEHVVNKGFNDSIMSDEYENFQFFKTWKSRFTYSDMLQEIVPLEINNKNNNKKE